MANPDKNRLVEIPPRSGEPPDGGFDIGTVSTSNEAKDLIWVLYANCTCAGDRSEPLTFFASKWHCVRNFIACENRCSCQYADKRGRVTTTAKAMTFCA